AAALVFVNHGEGYLGASGLRDDVPPAADDHSSAALIHYCNQGNVVDKVDVGEKCDFLFREAAFDGKEAAEQRLWASLAYRCKHFGLVAGTNGTDLYSAPIASPLDCRIIGCLRHGP